MENEKNSLKITYRYTGMMFSKYISKITNTIGTINYLKQTSKRNSEVQLYLRNALVVEDDDNETNNNHIDIDLSSKRNHLLMNNFPIESQIISTAAVAKLRNTLFTHELV